MTGAVAIFTDEPGWHGRQLQQWLARGGYQAEFVSLSDCTVNVSARTSGGSGLHIPGFDDRLPQGAFVRGIAGGSLEAITLRLDVLHLLADLGCPVFNSARTIERSVDKAMTSLRLHTAGVPTPAAFTTASTEDLKTYTREKLLAGCKLVKKPLFGSQGQGLRLISSTDDVRPLLPGEIAYVQEFVEAPGDIFRDWRVMVVDGRAVAAMERRHNHWITNRAKGAQCHAVDVADDMAAIAVQAAWAIRAEYTGVDLLRNADNEWQVIEINGIPAWQGLQRATGINVTAALGAAFVRRMNAKNVRESA